MLPVNTRNIKARICSHSLTVSLKTCTSCKNNRSNKNYLAIRELQHNKIPHKLRLPVLKDKRDFIKIFRLLKGLEHVDRELTLR